MSKNKKNIFKNPMKFSIFTGEKNLCTLHGQVFIMVPDIQAKLCCGKSSPVIERCGETIENNKAIAPYPI